MSRKQRASKLKANSLIKIVPFDKFRKAKAFTEVSFEDRFSWEQVIVMDMIDLSNEKLRPNTQRFLETLLEVEEFAPYLEGKRYEKILSKFFEKKFNNIYQIFDTILAYLFPLNLPKLSNSCQVLLYIPKQIIKNHENYAILLEKILEDFNGLYVRVSQQEDIDDPRFTGHNELVIRLIEAKLCSLDISQ